MANAADASERLTLEQGATCLDHERLVARIVRWREGAEIDPSVSVQVRGDTREPRRVYFSVTRSGAEPAERVLDSAPSDCDQLHSAVALSIALAIDASLAIDRSTPLTAASSPSFEIEEEAPRAAAASSQHLELAILGGASVGVLPSTTPLAGPRVHYAPLPWLAFALEGLGTYATGLTIGSVPGEFDATLFGVGLDTCLGGETDERLGFFMCAGARGGSFTTRGTTFARNRQETQPWWAVTASGQARAWLLPTVGIGIGIEAVFALAARDIVVRQEGSDGEQRLPVPRIGLVVTGGPVFRFF